MDVDVTRKRVNANGDSPAAAAEDSRRRSSRLLGKKHDGDDMVSSSPPVPVRPPRGGHEQIVDEPELDAGLSLPHIPVGDLFSHPSTPPAQTASDISGDGANIALLLCLYVLQGIPLGLAGAMPFLLQNRQVSYGQQALFSFVFWPFSLKLLWAPVVDSLYWRRLGGLRKSWLVPTQYLIGAFMLLLSYNTKSLLGDGTEEGHPHILWLTTVFFCLNFLAATQDIAVDGWALTMLQPRNVGYASTCNTVGQTAGYFLGNILFLTLESSDFANRYVRSVPDSCGLVTLSGFLYFWGVVFIVCTTLVLVFKQERRGSGSDHHVAGGGDGGDGQHDDDVSVLSTYLLLWDILKKLPVRTYVLILLTMKIGFAAADSVTGLKLIEFGVPKESLALLAVPMIPLQILLPWIISRYTHGERPLDLVLSAYPYRLAMGVVFAGIVYVTPGMKVVTVGEGDGTEHISFPYYYYGLLILCYALHQVTLYSMFVAIMAFNARISDPRIGGTYMTLLNTVSNLGGNWPGTVVLSAVDWLTVRAPCHTVPGTGGEQCDGTTYLDGYYVETALCTALGAAWLLSQRHSVRRVQTLPRAHWRVTQGQHAATA